MFIAPNQEHWFGNTIEAPGNPMVLKILVSAVLAIVFGTHAPAQIVASGGISDALAKLDPFIEQTMLKTKVPGLAVAVVYKTSWCL
jgi:hypothetical protein